MSESKWDWNYGDILDAVIPVIPPDHPALIHGSRTITWSQLDVRSNRLARSLAASGLEPGAKVAFYMRNRPEFMETLAACLRGRYVHVNINYRYIAEEVFYIFDNSDAEAIVYDSEFRDVMEILKTRLGKVKVFIEVTPDGKVAAFASDYNALVDSGDGSPLGIERSRDDMLFIYTGGTTGMPKGVMWRAGDLREAQLNALRVLGPAPETLPEWVEAVAAEPPVSRILPACPLMHGTGLITSLGSFMGGGTIITLEDPSLSSEELWSSVERNGATTLAIVGDAFAKPMLLELDNNPGKYNLTSVETIISSGVMWSSEVKQALLKHMPQATMTDSFGASEALGFGSSLMTIDGEIKTAKFQISEHCKVFDENDRLVEPGSGIPGFIARGGAIPVGYYKDEEKSAKTFKTIDGERYSIPGDWCTVEVDGTLTLLGRGSVCINTAGEKVYPEEIEEVLKTHPCVDDALVVGVPDDKWGQSVTGIIRLNGGTDFDEAELRSHVRGQLAGYKTPKRILVGQMPFRAPNGKADYKTVTEFALSELGIA